MVCFNPYLFCFFFIIIIYYYYYFNILALDDSVSKAITVTRVFVFHPSAYILFFSETVKYVYNKMLRKGRFPPYLRPFSKFNFKIKDLFYRFCYPLAFVLGLAFQTGQQRVDFNKYINYIDISCKWSHISRRRSRRYSDIMILPL